MLERSKSHVLLLLDHVVAEAGGLQCSTEQNRAVEESSFSNRSSSGAPAVGGGRGNKEATISCDSDGR